MNNEYYRIQTLINDAESKAVDFKECLYRNGFHIMPPTGWLNDPNGLCQFKGEYHLFFQYSPLDARGGMKVWGHYVTKDFINFDYLGAPFVPDESFDKDGVYSGSTIVDENGMHIFYTGNVKLDGDYDYTYSGRRADTVLVESKNGRSFTEKKVVIDTDEYPKDYSCHIRDPKVWRENDLYYMVLGARTSNDEGRILLYKSDNMLEWTIVGEIASKNKLGYMWECPDSFELDGVHVISFSPQGLDKQEYRYQNIYQSGYVIDERNPVVECNNNPMMIAEESFTEWDMGFDFYAPQTFCDESGRRIIIGWAGVPDAEYKNGEVERENWQHCFTVPRELSIKESGDGKKRVFQTPIKEIENLRIDDKISKCVIDKGLLNDSNGFDTVSVAGDEKICVQCTSDDGLTDIVCSNIKGVFSVSVDDNVTFTFNGDKCILELSDDYGLGRDIRKAELLSLNSLRILVDSSIIEYYINDGEMVFTTRFYKKSDDINISFNVNSADITMYPMNSTDLYI